MSEAGPPRPATSEPVGAALSVVVGGVAVHTVGEELAGPARQALQRAVTDEVAPQLIGQRPTLWGPEAESEAAIRLGWLDLPDSSRELVGRLAALHEELQGEGLDRVVLAGMGGSSLAPEVITRTAGVPLVVLDTTDPGQVRAAMTDLGRTLVVVSSKSGTTLETDSLRRVFAHAFAAAGLDKAAVARRFVMVTDPGSPLAEDAEAAGVRAVFLADPNVGGRYSALSAFGLVPSLLAGAEAKPLLDAAGALLPALGRSADNPGLTLGAALGGAGVAGHDKVVLAAEGAAAGAGASSGLVGFGDWAEQLIAESTGKQGRGLLPVVVEDPAAPGFAPADDVHLVTLGAAAAAPGTSVAGPLGAQFLLWEYAIAVAGRVLAINPFDQPNVAESKANTNHILGAAGDGPLPEGEPAFTDGAVEVYADRELLAGAGSLADALAALLAAVPEHGYLAVMAYLDRHADARATQLRPALASRLAHPVTFGWGPRFLHSTGQFHKGGPQVGAFLQVTGAVTEDLPVPGRPFTLGRLQAAQALGDLPALTGRGRPVLRLHLRDRAAGVAQLLDTVGRR